MMVMEEEAQLLAGHQRFMQKTTIGEIMRIKPTSISELADMIGDSNVVSQVEVGSSLFVTCVSAIHGEFIAISTAEGACAVIAP